MDGSKERFEATKGEEEEGGTTATVVAVDLGSRWLEVPERGLGQLEWGRRQRMAVAMAVVDSRLGQLEAP